MLQRTVNAGEKKVKINVSKARWTFRLFDRNKLVDTFQTTKLSLHSTGSIRDWLSRQNASALGVDTINTIHALKKELKEYH